MKPHQIAELFGEVVFVLFLFMVLPTIVLSL